MLHSLDGFERAEIMRFAYAIEYDCAEPTQMDATLAFKAVDGLYGAGQFNGTSGYEEAAAQGLVAGINAVLSLRGEEPLVLPRSSSYIGTLIDDLVTKGTAEPYRIMTSRSEYRLLLRQDNADARLSEYGHRVGLIGEERYRRFREKQERIEREIARLEAVNVPPSEAVNALLMSYGSTPIKTGVKLAELIRRPELSYEKTRAIDPERPAYFEDGDAEGLTRAIRTSVEVRVKYKGYIERERAAVERQRKMERMALPEDIDYAAIVGLRLEAAEKLARIRPLNIGQASRISGVNPADISVLLIYLEAQKQR
jgi:tRNA uridine 5-carboxymethylaminomethyl modification enzyme